MFLKCSNTYAIFIFVIFILILYRFKAIDKTIVTGLDTRSTPVASCHQLIWYQLQLNKQKHAYAGLTREMLLWKNWNNDLIDDTVKISPIYQ